MEGFVEVAGKGSGVPEQQHLGVVRRHGPLDGFEDPLPHPGRLVNHEEDVPFVEALEALRRVGREALGVVLVIEFERGPKQLAAHDVLEPSVDAPDLAPEHVADLVLRRRGGDDDRVVETDEPPQDRVGRNKRLA